MSNIYKAFENKKAFIPFVTGGDPDLETTKNLLIAMEKAGADLIEIGIPFSDPIAEGPVIQEASQRALAAGCTTDKLFGKRSPPESKNSDGVYDLYQPSLYLRKRTLHETLRRMRH